MEKTEKLNCWEYFKCGREEGGINEAQLGACPASRASKEIGELQGIHDGKHGGRCCWVIAGTMCAGKVQGTFARKYDNCTRCEFYKRVREEEGRHFNLASVLLALKDKPREALIWAD